MENKTSVGISMRRRGACLRSMTKSHGLLHVLIWQAQEAQSALKAAASAQKILFNDMAAWASTENRALSDVCSCASELTSLYTAAMTQLAYAFKALKKEMTLILEGERRCDAVQKKLHDAENKRIKLRREVLRVQNRMQTESDPRRFGDFTALQTKLAEAERTAERTHMEACEVSREQEAVKLVVVKSALNKLTDSQLKFSSETKTIVEGIRELAVEVPDPPPPGDALSSVRYTGYDRTRGIVDRVKTHVVISRSNTPGNSSRMSSAVSLQSRNSLVWSPHPSAPDQMSISVLSQEPPPPYIT